MRQTPLTCSGHTRPVVDLAFSGITPYGYFLISACKGERCWQDYEHKVACENLVLLLDVVCCGLGFEMSPL